MIKVEVTVDTDIFDALNDALLKSGDKLARQYGIELQKLRQRGLNALRQQPGKPRYPIRWTSERQRRYVMAKLRRMKQIPYVRTGQFVDSWRIEFGATSNGGIFEVFNPAKNSRGDFIEQYITGTRQQGFHQDTGWYQSQNIITDIMVDAEETLIELWGRILDI
jgi:hypothetical protein